VRPSPLTLAALATAAIPGLDVVATRAPQHDGADFAVTGVMDSGGRRWVVRCPVHAAAGAALEGEVALLERLCDAVDDGDLPFAVPRPAGFAPLPDGGRAMVYRELVGRPLDLENLRPGPHLAAEIGRAIAAIHELPIAVIESAGLPVYDAESYRLRRLAELDEAARTGYVPAVLLRRWEKALENVALWRFRATPVHGDLAADHVLVANDEVRAVLDWSEARVADPADDLAWLVAGAPENALDSVLEAYSLARTERGDDHLVERATLAGELALARWLLHGVRVGDRTVVDDAAQMLADLAEIARRSPDIGEREVRAMPEEPGPDEGPLPRNREPETRTPGNPALDGADDASGQDPPAPAPGRPTGPSSAPDSTDPSGDDGWTPSDSEATQEIPLSERMP
jgi:macrolide phosphotransferase